MELWVEPADSDTGRQLSFWVAAKDHALLKRTARVGDRCFPKHRTWDHSDDEETPPCDQPVLDLRFGSNTTYGDLSFYGAWISEYVPDPGRRLPPLLRTDIAYFFFQIAALAAGNRGDINPRPYGPHARPASQPPSNDSLFSRFPCPACKKLLRSFDVECPRGDWSESRRNSVDTSEIPLYPDEVADT